MRAFRDLPRQAFLFHQTTAAKATNTGILASKSFQRSNHYRLPLQDIGTQRSCQSTYNRLSSRHRFFSSKPPNLNQAPKYNPTPNLNSPPGQPSLSLSQRLRKLSREYGWSAVGVYLLLSAFDLPLCFIAVRSIGTERIGEWEHAVVQWVKRAVPLQIPPAWRRGAATEKEIGGPAGEGVEKVEGIAGFDHGVLEAERANKGDSASKWISLGRTAYPCSVFCPCISGIMATTLFRSILRLCWLSSLVLSPLTSLITTTTLGIYTQLALAYAIHKSFIFIRVPLTAAVTPKVVRTLRGWGWDIGKRKPKA